jgi:hypothetical protein
MGRQRVFFGIISAVLFCQGHLHYPLLLATGAHGRFGLGG